MRWILCVKPGQMSYKKRLLSLNMHPLGYDREIKDILFCYKAIHPFNHPSERRGQTAGCYLTVLTWKTCTFHASYFVLIVRLWNTVCSIAIPDRFTSPGFLSPF